MKLTLYYVEDLETKLEALFTKSKGGSSPFVYLKGYKIILMAHIVE